MNIRYFRFANSYLEAIRNRNYVSSAQITLAEEFGVGGRGGFYETAGCLRDVIENQIFQIVALLAMESPASRDFGAVHNEQAKVFEATRPLVAEGLVRSGQLSAVPAFPQFRHRSRRSRQARGTRLHRCPEGTLCTRADTRSRISIRTPLGRRDEGRWSAFRTRGRG